MTRGCERVLKGMRESTPQAFLDFAQSLVTEQCVTEQIRMMTIRMDMENVDEEIPF